VVDQGRLEDCPVVTPPRVESPGRLGELPELGPPSRYEVERVLLGYDVLTLGARVPRNKWEYLRNISRSGSILLHCNQQTHLWHI